MDQTQTYRRYVRECLTGATKAGNQADRKRFLEMAAAWHKLAVLSAAWAATPQPVSIQNAQASLPPNRYALVSVAT